MTMGQLRQANNTIALALVVVLIVLGWVVPFGAATEVPTVRGAINEQMEAEGGEKDTTVAHAPEYKDSEGLFPQQGYVPSHIADGGIARRALGDGGDHDRPAPFYVLCYGDQITAGYIDDSSEEHPYARRMKQILKAQGLGNTEISFKGMKRWTAEVMVEHIHSPKLGLAGLIRSHINEHERPPHLVILNAGYNDMWHVENPGEIVANLKRLTQAALDLGVEKVLILDLQPSVVRVRSQQKDTWARLVNRLKTLYAQENDDVVSVTFPFGFDPSNRDYFSDDKTNLSDMGHKQLGTALAPIVQTQLVFGGHVFCYGDSLTAGVSDPGSGELTPYAPYLEEALTGTYPKFQLVGNVVDHMGLPGWTTEHMLEKLDDPRFGLNRWIELSPKVIDVLVIMTGTNDLFTSKSAHDIATDIIALHKVALASPKVRYTVSVDIPPSLDRLQDTEMNEKGRDVNRKVGEWVRLNPRVQRFLFPFVYKSGGMNWASDQLHFSVHGYENLGQALAPVVRDMYRRKDE